MPRMRFFGSGMALMAGMLALTCAVAPVSAQSGVDLKPFKKDAKPLPGDSLSKMLDLRSGKLRTAGPDLKANRELFKQVAESIVNLVTHEQYYTMVESGELKPKPYNQTIESVIKELESQILVPTAETRFTPDQADYIKEFGVALDGALRGVLAQKTIPPAILRINIGRLLAVAARSGAPAHAKMIQELLTNQFFKVNGKSVETPPEILYYTLKAAEALIGAYDPLAYGTTTPGKHSIPLQELVPLVKTIETMVLTNPPVADRAASWNPDQPTKPPLVDPMAKDAKAPMAPAAPMPKGPMATTSPGMTPEQVALIQYFRRQAVRALGKVRSDILGGEVDIPQVRPGYTLAKVAVSDVSINPPPSSSEVAEAVIGLCGILPSQQLQVDEMDYVIAYGVGSFIRPRTFDAKDKTVAWKTYGARMAAAFAGMKKNTQTNARLRPFAQAISALSDAVTADVLTPLEKEDPSGAGAAAPNLDRVFRWMEQNVPKDTNRSFYNDSPQYRLNPRPAGS